MKYSRSSDKLAGAGQFSRRQFIRAGALGATAVSFPFVGNVLGANDKINVACIGVRGRGEHDVKDTAKCGPNIVALCDVDQRHLDFQADNFPRAALFRDYRKMFEKMEKSIDAVTIATPDHCHALITLMAMSLGKHVYCEKPLTQTVSEARQVRDLAARKKVATQMGTQGSAFDYMRRAIEVVQAGVIGPVRQVHVWSNRPIWPQGLDRPPGQDPVPSGLDWDAWIGPAPMRPYKSGVYHPFKWRGWFDFGTGALGDMACHQVNMPFRALKMGYPTAVECEAASTLFSETYPKSSRIRFDFPQREGLPPLKFWWYDGNPDDKSVPAFRPPPELTREANDPAFAGKLADYVKKLDNFYDKTNGALLIGDKGKIYSPGDFGLSFLMLAGEKGYEPLEDHEAARAIPQSIPRSPGHNEEWFRMMRDGTPAFSNFSIAAYLTEIILLGCVALRVGVGKEMQWDAQGMKSPNCPEAAQFLRRRNRDGWPA